MKQPLTTKLSSTIRFLLALLVAMTLGCRSRGVDVTIQNNAPVPIRNVEVDYPGAAFGAGSIAPGASYWYHIKPSGDGDVTLSFEPEKGKAVKQKVPLKQAASGGRMVLLVEQNPEKQWQVRLQTNR